MNTKYGRNKNFNPAKLSSHNIDYQTVSAVPYGSSVLEIGCATGFMGKYLIKQKKCKVIGVENRHNEARIARHVLTDVIIGDIEDAKTLAKIKGKFDIVLASALIQHLSDPEKALTNWKKYLKNDGKLLITSSNITHWSARFAITKGKFEPQEYGLFDNTHLHFFTPETFKQIIKRAGYKTIHFSIDAEAGGGFPRINILLSKMFPNLFAYQMLIEAKKNE